MGWNLLLEQRLLRDHATRTDSGIPNQASRSRSRSGYTEEERIGVRGMVTDLGEGKDYLL